MAVSRQIQLTRVVRFSAAHRYHSDELSDEENRAVFGKCNSPHGHGHEYRLEVTVSGEVDPVTGMVINLADLDRILKQEIVERFDHRFLNYDVEHFSRVVPTCENIAVYVHALLIEKLSPWPVTLRAVRLFESDDLYSEVGDSGVS